MTEPPPQNFPPLVYDTDKLKLNVATSTSTTVGRRMPTAAARRGDVAGAALDRCAAWARPADPGGTTGSAVDHRRCLDRAVTRRLPRRWRASRLSNADGTKSGHAEAQVTRVRTLGDDTSPEATARFVRDDPRMMDDMNVELEYQLRQSLAEYLQTTSPASAPPPVELQDSAAAAATP